VYKADYEQLLIYSIINAEPEPVEKLRPEIPSDLLQIVNKTLEKEPENHPLSACLMRLCKRGRFLIHQKSTFNLYPPNARLSRLAGLIKTSSCCQ